MDGRRSYTGVSAVEAESSRAGQAQVRQGMASTVWSVGSGAADGDERPALDSGKTLDTKLSRACVQQPNVHGLFNPERAQTSTWK